MHHAVLLWPFPQFLVALALAEASRRLAEASWPWKRWGSVAFGTVVAFLCVTNLLVTNQYLACLIRYGPTVTWSDAIYPLSNSLANETREVIVMDWDIYDPLLLLHGGGAHMYAGFFQIINDPPGQAERAIDGMLSDQPAVFVTHTRDNQFFPLANQKLEAAAAARGYSKQLLRTVADGHGRRVFEVFQFVKE